MTNFKEDTKIMNALSDFKVKCKHCGYPALMSKADRCICKVCGKWIYRNSTIEFKYKMLESLRKVKNDRG